MPTQTAIQNAIEMLEIAATQHGENDRADFVEAKEGLQSLVNAVYAHDKNLNDTMVPPNGDDYNDILDIIEVRHSSDDDDAPLQA